MRCIFISAAGVFILWLAVGVTLDRTLGTRAPAVALSIWPHGAAANVGAVSNILRPGERKNQVNAAGLAAMRAAISREPANSSAVANYAALTEITSDTATARKFFKLSETLSRRNVLAQTWLIEDAVRRGDIADAIIHYDRALSVSEALRPQLLPILTAAATDPEIGVKLWPVLSRRPPWWSDFLSQLTRTGDSAATINDAARAVRLDGRNAADAVLAEPLLRRMIFLKDYKRANLLVAALSGSHSASRGLVDGDFKAPDGIMPYGWWLSDGRDVRAFRDQIPGGTGLRIETSAGVSGGAAQQLIGLSPGSYVISGIVGDHVATDTAGLRVAIVCADGVEVSRIKLPTAGPDGRRFVVRFKVPAEACQAQWVNLAATGDEPMRAWVAKLKIDTG